jgi:photosystem II stability/assembly factor-like uncharacterized protein
MREHDVSDRIHDAFEFEPLPGGFDRLRMALATATIDSRPRLRPLSARRWAPLVAGLIAVAVAASAIGYGLAMRQSAVSRPRVTPTALQPVMAYWAYSADDVAVQLSQANSPSQPSRSYVLITHNGGKSWAPTPLDLAQVNLRWIDSRHIVATMDDVGNPFEMASSSDGGASWHITRMPEFQIGTMFFLNDHEGWALCTNFGACEAEGDKTILYHTVDGGAHWQPLSSPVILPTIVPLGLTFSDNEHGLMSTLDTDSVARLLRTADGGKTWHVIELPPPAGSGSVVGGSAAVDCGSKRCALDPVLFGPRGVVTVIGQGIAPYTVTTGDAGVTWRSPHPMPFSSPASMPTPWLQPRDADNWWVVDDAGSLFTTKDAGASWRRVPTSLPHDYVLDAVTAGENGMLWGVTRETGSGRYPLVSADGGQTWSAVLLPKA